MRFICPVNKHECIFAENSHEKHQAILDEDESAEGCRPLMLQELIVKSDFGAMMKYITKFDKKMTGLDRHFFRAVEYIRHMKLRYKPEPIIAQYEYGGPFVWIL